MLPFGAWAEQTLVPEDDVWDVLDHVDGRTAVAMGIDATGALVPLEQATIKRGENVLILGATGILGQIVLRLARYQGAGHAAAATRDGNALERLRQRRTADAVASLQGEDDIATLIGVSNGGFDVVLNLVCGQPMRHALKATRWGPRTMTMHGANRKIDLDIADLLFRALSCIGTGQRPAPDRAATWERCPGNGIWLKYDVLVPHVGLAKGRFLSKAALHSTGQAAQHCSHRFIMRLSNC